MPSLGCDNGRIAQDPASVVLSTCAFNISGKAGGFYAQPIAGREVWEVLL
jgi:hypothetical protein